MNCYHFSQSFNMQCRHDKTKSQKTIRNCPMCTFICIKLLFEKVRSPPESFSIGSSYLDPSHCLVWIHFTLRVYKWKAQEHLTNKIFKTDANCKYSKFDISLWFGIDQSVWFVKGLFIKCVDQISYKCLPTVSLLPKYQFYKIAEQTLDKHLPSMLGKVHLPYGYSI